VANSGVSFVLIKDAEIQSFTSNAEGRLRSHVYPREMGGGQRGASTSSLPSDYVDFPQSGSFQHSNIITFQSHTHRRYITLATEVDIKKFKTESLWIPGM
jgi:hypothetical protein